MEQRGAMHTPGHQRDAQLASFKGETIASMGVNKTAQVEDHYYKKEKYDALTLDQKKVLHEKCGNCSHKRVPRIVPIKFETKDQGFC